MIPAPEAEAHGPYPPGNRQHDVGRATLSRLTGSPHACSFEKDAEMRQSPTAVSPGGIGTDFGRLWIASTAGNLGDGIARIAIPLLAAQVTRDPFAIALVTALTYLPWLIFGVPAGVLIDRYDRRRLAVLAATVRIVALTTLAVAAAVDGESIVVLYAVVVVLYTGEAIYESAIVATVPMVVTKQEDLERANGRLEGARLIADRFIGPPLASLLFVPAAAYAFSVNIACYVLAAALLLTLPGSFRVRPPSGSPEGGSASMALAMGAGLRFILGHPLLRLLLWLMMAIGFVSGMVNAVIVLWALDVLGVSEAFFGVFMLALAGGGVAGSQAAAAMSRRVGRGRALWLSLLVGGGASLVAASTTSAFLAGVGLAGVGWSIVVFNVVNVSLRQRLAPAEMLGRVTATFRSAAVSIMLVGALTGGAVASAVDLRLPWLLCGLGCLLISALTVGRLDNKVIDRAVAGDASVVGL